MKNKSEIEITIQCRYLNYGDIVLLKEMIDEDKDADKYLYVIDSQKNIYKIDKQ